MKQIYLDYAAATPIDTSVLQAMQPYFAEKFYNPSATYLAARSVAKDIEAARARVAHWLGARPPEIIFTAGGTEANNLAIRGVMEHFPGKQAVISAIEHDSILAPSALYDHRKAPVGADGSLDIEAFRALISDDTVLVSVMYANNEIGTVQSLSLVGNLLKEVRHERRKKGNTLPIYFHTDACQAANYLHLHANRLGVDLMTINAGKIYGPKQCGALYVKAGTRLSPQILGGGQERGMRSGTENPAHIIGFAAALELAQTKREDEAARLTILRQHFLEALQAAIPTVVINGGSRRLPNNLHVTFPGQDNERLLMALDEQGIICASGSACSASKEEASHVLRAIGKTDAEAYASLRFSMGRDTTQKDIDRVVNTLAGLLR